MKNKNFRQLIALSCTGLLLLVTFLHSEPANSPEDENVRNAIAAIEQERGLKFKIALTYKILPPDQSNLQGLYDPAAKTLYVKKSSNPTREYATVIHEAFHGLQDQYFDIIKLQKNAKTTDQSYTIKSILEGDATYLAIVCLPESRMNKMMTMTPPWKQKSSEGQKLASSSLMSFDYAVGANFIKQVKEEKGWAGVNKIYERIPRSTEQILHPHKYLENPDEPVKVTLPDFPALSDAGWQTEKVDTVGEFMTMLRLIQNGLSGPEAETAATGWGGDTSLVLRKEKQTCEIWKTVWDTKDDSLEFFKTMAQILKDAFPNINGEETEKENTISVTYQIQPDYFVFLSLNDKNKEVVLLKNLSKNNLLEAVKLLNLPSPHPDTLK
ncbi:MAG: hypothetical protein AAB019_00250 [Planctomycetota bacterium]